MAGEIGGPGDDRYVKRVEKPKPRALPATPASPASPASTGPTDPPQSVALPPRSRTERPSTDTIARLSRESEATTSRNPAASQTITRRQAHVSANLTGAPVSFDELSADERRLTNLAAEIAEREEAEAQGRTLLRDGEYIDPSDAHLYAQAEQLEKEREEAAAQGRTVLRDGEYVDPSDVRLHNLADSVEAEKVRVREAAAAQGRTLWRDGEYIDPSDAHLYGLGEKSQAEAETPATATTLAQDLQDSNNPEQLIAQQMPEILASLEGAPPEVVSKTLEQFSQIAHDNPALADELAKQFGEHPPENLSAALEGLANSSAQGRPELAGAIAHLFESQENPTAAQFRSVANLADAVGDINTALEPGSLAGAGQAADRISTAIAGAPPEVAQALLKQLGVDGSLSEISGILDLAANKGHVDGPYAVDVLGTPFWNNPTEPLGEGDHSSIHVFDRVIGSLSQAVTAAADDEMTQMVAGHVANAIGETDIRRFDEAFGLTIGMGGGAGLAGAVATQLQADGRTEMANRVAESVETGAGIFLYRFDQIADRVDQSNADLNYLLTQWGPFYGQDEAGQAALNAQVLAFREGQPEYAELEAISATMGGDLEVLRDLQSVFPDKDHLKDRELAMLAEVPRFAQTDSGRRALGEAVARHDQGEPTFLDRLDDADFIDSLPKDYYEKLGYENRESFRNGLNQQVLNGFFSLMAESASRGDMEKVGQLESGILGYHEFLGEDRDALDEVIRANRELMTSSISFTKEGAGAGSGAIDDAARRFSEATKRLHNPATANRFLAGGVVAAVGAGGLSWWAASRGGLEAPEAISASVDTLEGLLMIGSGVNSWSSGQLLKPFTKDFVKKGGAIFGVAGAVLDGYSFVQAANKGDWAQAGISGLSMVGGIATALGATGIGLALGIGAAVIGVGYAQYKKVEASNRYEGDGPMSDEAGDFIRGALEHAGVPTEELDTVIGHLRNSSDEGLQAGILLAQAAQRLGIEPIELLRFIAEQDEGTVKKIIETGAHMVVPQSDDLTDLLQTYWNDPQVGEPHNPFNYTHYNPEFDNEVRSVQGFINYLEHLGLDVPRGHRGPP